MDGEKETSGVERLLVDMEESSARGVTEGSQGQARSEARGPWISVTDPEP
jgi:hypothetical protein